MPRLFVFAIGGTGTRVLKSLTMLLAAGIKPAINSSFEIVPIIIDPHKASDAMKKTMQLMTNYQKIRAAAECEDGFFGARISTLENIVSSENRFTDNFVFKLQEVSNTKFKDYIDYNQLDEANKALANVLFSGTSINKLHQKVDLLDVEMDIGFVGNPNIGSVVLNQFKDSDEFQEFANNFNENDRIFIVSSIFGGTGAAGFPTILKNIRNARNIANISTQGYLENAPIGAITVLPYFNIEGDDNSPIRQAEWIAKTRSALYYYQENVSGIESGNSSINALYYIGDDFRGKAYKNDPGDGGQSNDAHVVELMSALSIIDFLEIPDSELQCNNGRAIKPIFKEFSIRNNKEALTFSDFEEQTERKISLPLAQLALFKRYCDNQMRESQGKASWTTDEPFIDNLFAGSPFYRNYLSDFLHSYSEWLKELQDNRRSFAPLNMAGDLETLIKDKTVRKTFFGSKVSYDLIDGELNKASKGISFSGPEKKLLDLFHTATEKILREKFALKN